MPGARSPLHHSIGKLLLAFAVCALAEFPCIGQQQQAAGRVLTTVSTASPVAGQIDKFEEKYSPPGGGFSVLMPGKPLVESQEVETPLGKLINHVHSAEASEMNFAVMYSDFPEPVTDINVINRMLDNARVQGLSAVHGELTSEKAISLDGNPGREWFVRLPSGALLRARAYWVTQRFYQIMVQSVATKNPEINKSREVLIKKFFDSFTLTSNNVPIARARLVPSLE